MNLEKESPQYNGGAVYSETDTFGLCLAGRLVRHDAPLYRGAERQPQRRETSVAA